LTTLTAAPRWAKRLKKVHGRVTVNCKSGRMPAALGSSLIAAAQAGKTARFSALLSAGYVLPSNSYGPGD
jgi:hypothetical protein